jgi:RNA polymerase sigma factor (sigma-70 family)
VTELDWLAERFEQQRDHLRAVAYRMLGSLPEAEDAVQDAWLRVSRSDASGIENLSGWLTTITARICLDALRARRARREVPIIEGAPEPVAAGVDPAQEAELADSVGLAMLVVLETLAPAERLAFVLHDMFDVPFEEIAPIVGRSPTAARQLASRARRRVRGGQVPPGRDLDRQREVVEAYLAAARRGDFEALLGVLDPEVVLRADAAAQRAGAPSELRGAAAVGRGALAAARGGGFARLALLDGRPGLIVAPRGRLRLALAFEVANGRVVAIDAIGDPARLAALAVAVLPDPYIVTRWPAPS